MPRFKFPAPTLGVDQLSDETRLRRDERGTVQAVREAVNVDIDRDGNVSRRRGAELKLSGSGYHSLYAAQRGWVFVCHKQELGLFNTETSAFVALVDMNDAMQTSYTELNGNVYAFNPNFSCYFPPGSTTSYTVGVDLPPTQPVFEAASDGQLTAGTYGITYTVVAENGEESGTGPITTVEVTDGAIQGTFFMLLSGAKYRIYLTTANGEELYQAVEFDATVTSFKITQHEQGRQPRTQDLEPLPYGYTVRAYNSRLFVATNDFVFFSEAFRPHLYNPAHNFLPTTGFTTLVQPVDRGIYIGDQRGVRFYAGDDPTSFQVQEVSSEVPVFNTGIAVPGDYLNPELGAGRDLVALWLTSSGYNLGMPDGQLIRLNAAQVRLPRYVQGCAATLIKDGRKQVITPVNSNSIAAVSVAEDSTVG